MSSHGRGVMDWALDCPSDTEYHEDAFLYFLDMERARAGRSNLPVQLLFATLEPVPGKPVPIPPTDAGKLFEGLRVSLRETDIMGWYRQDRVAGAVLSARPDSPAPTPPGLIEQRVGEGLRRHLPEKAARSLRVRVIQLGPQRVLSA